jgi:RHS repeat-associated protein
LKDDNTFGLVDDLSMTVYDGNRLRKVTDSAGDQSGSDVMEFKDGYTQPDEEYIYYSNGSLMADYNRNICMIKYNYLTLPQSVQFRYGHRIEYLYDAAGVRHRTRHREANHDLNLNYSNWSLAEPAESDILHTTVTDYVGNKIYKNGVLKVILTEEGYIEKENNMFNPYYYLKDHLGNNRIVMNSSGTVVQATNHYPSGTSIAEYPRRTDQGVQPYKFGGKELDRTNGLDFYDFEARAFDPTLMRFTTIDPLAEKYYNISPYAYCANNPLRYIDPTGLAYRPKKNEDGEYDGFEWVDDLEAYDENNVLKDGYFDKAILFVDNGTWTIGTYQKNKYVSFNIGSATATVYDYTETVNEDGTVTQTPNTSTYNAMTNPSNPDVFGTVAKNQLLQAVKHDHKGDYPALQMRTLKGSANIPAEGGANPSNGSKFVGGANIHKAGKSNVTGFSITEKGMLIPNPAIEPSWLRTTTNIYSGISEGCFLIDVNKWNAFMGHFPAGVGKIGVINK